MLKFYFISISWSMFVLSSGLALLITLTSVSFQAIKMATANSMDSLKHE
jgi:putative ABC transport system permease protein